ncbi:FAD:protein FMN transferase [Skermanella mucosa]|uniref:FAD:protein FMN transferase n=1 Tax=Skermanella mucosa TaxID=1789672 RepID=UPI00192BEC88|nr:FAD:protein FMN transferase [Skermanella mucosa]UEM20830.1 FAD:protein FMN transferase [Skermanella mucosa]
MTPVSDTTRGDVMPRRRVLQLLGAAAGCLLVPQSVASGADAGILRHEWTGTALGAVANITLFHPDPAEARSIIGACLTEIDRLESEFSLFRPGSALCRLNRDGELLRPSLDMRRLLTEAARFGDLSDGRFDVTVQPLWRLLATHREAGTVPRREDLRAALALIDYHRIEITSRRIRFGQPGMGVTLNGIAQGYVTDRVAELLRARGIEHVLLDLGEMRALGPKPDGRPWRIGVRDPGKSDHVLREFDVINRAVATSAGSADLNILDPRKGKGGALYSSVTVVIGSATAADALSTALCLTPQDEVEVLVAKVGPATVLLAGNDWIRLVEHGPGIH